MVLSAVITYLLQMFVTAQTTLYRQMNMTDKSVVCYGALQEHLVNYTIS